MKTVTTPKKNSKSVTGENKNGLRDALAGILGDLKQKEGADNVKFGPKPEMPKVETVRPAPQPVSTVAHKPVQPKTPESPKAEIPEDELRKILGV